MNQHIRFMIHMPDDSFEIYNYETDSLSNIYPELKYMIDFNDINAVARLLWERKLYGKYCRCSHCNGKNFKWLSQPIITDMRKNDYDFIFVKSSYVSFCHQCESDAKEKTYELIQTSYEVQLHALESIRDGVACL